MKTVHAFVILTLVAVSFAGCGTVNSMAHSGRDTPLIYAGTRLDVAAIKEDSSTLEKFEAEPPTNPKADLPASLVLDTVLLPGTLLVAAFRAMFW